MRELNFNTINRYTFRVVLDDENQTALDVKLANKGMINALLITYGHMNEIAKYDEKKADLYNDLTNLCARLLSYNRQGITYTAEQIDKMWSVDDMALFIQAYTNFIYDITKEKN